MALVFQILEVTTRIARWLAIVAAFGLAVMMAINFIDVVGTKFFLKSVPGALDMSEELMVFLTLLPMAFIALERGHIRITIVEDRLPPAVRTLLQIFQYAMALLITGFITWRVFAYFQKTLAVGQLKQGIDLPIWPANLAVVLAFAFLTLAWALLLVKSLVLGSRKGRCGD